MQSLKLLGKFAIYHYQKWGKTKQDIQQQELTKALNTWELPWVHDGLEESMPMGKSAYNTTYNSRQMKTITVHKGRLDWFLKLISSLGNMIAL